MWYHFTIKTKNGETVTDDAKANNVKKAALQIIGMYPGCRIMRTYDENWREITPKEIFG